MNAMKHLPILAILVCSPLLLAQGTVPITTVIDTLPDLEREKASLETILVTSAKLKGNALWAYLVQLRLPDDNFPKLMPKYIRAKSKKERLISEGKGVRDAEVFAASDEIKELQTKLDSAAVDLLNILRIKLDFASARLERAKEQRAKEQKL